MSLTIFRAAVFLRVVAFLAAGFFRAAGLRAATVVFRAAVFLRVALLALLLLAGITITFLIVGISPIHTIEAVRCPERGRIVASLCGHALPPALLRWVVALLRGDRSAVAGKHQRNHQRN